MLNQISPHVYWLPPDSSTDRPVLGVIAGQRATLIVDAGNSPAHANLLLDELAKLDVPGLTYLVLTHWHWDHVFGITAFQVPVFASKQTCVAVAQMVDLDWCDEALDQRVDEGTEIEFCRDMIKLELPDRSNLRLRTPDVAFTHQIEIDLGGVTCLIKHVGGDHASDSSIVHVQEDGIVFLGDAPYEDLHHGPRNYTTDKLFPLLDDILSCDAEAYLWGHDPEPMSGTEFAAMSSLLKQIGQFADHSGGDRTLILQQLQNVPANFEEDVDEFIDSFLAGLPG